jgi:hypothetical protein
MDSSRADNNQSPYNFVDENEGKVSPRPKLGLAISGNLLGADDTATGGIEHHDEGWFNTHAL